MEVKDINGNRKYELESKAKDNVNNFQKQIIRSQSIKRAQNCGIKPIENNIRRNAQSEKGRLSHKKLNYSMDNVSPNIEFNQNNKSNLPPISRKNRIHLLNNQIEKMRDNELPEKINIEIKNPGEKNIEKGKTLSKNCAIFFGVDCYPKNINLENSIIKVNPPKLLQMKIKKNEEDKMAEFCKAQPVKIIKINPSFESTVPLGSKMIIERNILFKPDFEIFKNHNNE